MLLPIYIPKRWLAVNSTPGRHTIRFHDSLVSLSKHGAVWFLFGGFTSTAGYVPGNEA